MLSWYWKWNSTEYIAFKLSFHAFGDTYAELPVVIQEATTFVLACYGYPERRNMPDTRLKVWKNRVGKSSKYVSN